MQIFRGLEEWGRDRALSALSHVMSPPPVSPLQAADSLRQLSSPKILLIGLFQHMGQFLCSTPLIRSLKAAWPQASVQFLGNPVNAVAAKANPRLDRVWVWEKSSFLGWAGQIRALRKEHFDLAILLTTERPSATGVFIARVSKVRWVAAYVPPNAGSWAKNASALCHIRIPFAGEQNEVEKYLGLARAFGLPDQGRQPELVPSADDEAAADSFLSAKQLAGKKPLIGLFIGGKAERSDRLWPATYFARLADSLKQAGCHGIALCPPPPHGASSSTFLPEEHLRLAEFQRALGSAIPIFQDGSIGRVAAFLKRLDLLVCPDGGILHVAASVGTPTLGLFFSTDPAVWRHDLRQTFLDGRERPSSEMQPETVAKEAIRFLGVSAPS